jgi:integrase
VDDNPCKLVKSFILAPRDRYVTHDEYLAVYNIAPQIIQSAMEIASIAGIRQGDILNLKYSDITDEGVHVKQGKTGKKQIFELTPGLLNAIELARSVKRSADSLIYILADTRGQKYKSTAFKRRWMNLIKKAVSSGLISEPFTFHDLRGKAASDAKKGDAQDLLGHSSSATTRRIYMRKPIVVTPIR